MSADGAAPLGDALEAIGPPLRIAMCITSYAPIVGGAERQLAQVARRMITAGHAVCVVTRHHPGLPLRETVDGVPVRRVAVRGPKTMRAGLFLLWAATALVRLRPDVIHCHGLFTPTAAGLLAGARLGAAVVAKPMRGEETGIIARKPLGSARLRTIARRVDAFAAVSREIETDLAAIGAPAEAVHAIPNGVDTDLFRPASRPDGAGLQVAFAGRMTAQKSVPVLTEAWARVARAAPGARLLVAEARRMGAAPPQEVAIRDALARQPGCEMRGHVSDMPAFLADADAFVLPSAAEGLSNALLEAGACGLGVVATSVGGTPDVIEHGRNGLLVPPGDPVALADALLTLIADPAGCRRMGAALRDTVERRYSIDATVARLLGLYDGLARDRPRRPAPIN